MAKKITEVRYDKSAADDERYRQGFTWGVVEPIAEYQQSEYQPTLYLTKWEAGDGRWCYVEHDGEGNYATVVDEDYGDSFILAADGY